MKNAIIGLLILVLAFTFYRVIQLENERYALTLGMCQQPASNLPDLSCLRDAETRTNWLWHLYYGLIG